MLPYTYVPGRCPHPVSHPAGHRFLGRLHVQALLDPDDWQSCDAFVNAVELFNAGYYWEAHEVWESCWHAAGRAGWLADYLKALIKLAAALVKVREGNAEGVRRHARRARELLEATASTCKTDRVAGLSLTALNQLAKKLDAEADTLTATHRNDDPYRPTCILPLSG